MFYAALIWVSCMSVFMAADAPAEKILFQFDRPFESAAIVEVDSRAKIVDGALRVTTDKDGRWPGVNLKAPKSGWDLLAFGYLDITINNPGDCSVKVHCNVESPGSDPKQFQITGAEVVAPGEQRILRIPLMRKLPQEMKKKFYGMKAYPGNYLEGPGIDTANVERLVIFAGNRNKAERTGKEFVFEVSLVRAGGAIAFPLPDDETKWFPMIDAFGQYNHKDWPGKIHNEDELQSRKKAEADDLAAHPGPDDWDQYGGWKSGPQLVASGRFRVEKVDGRWWLVDPEGRLFWSHGINCVEPGHDPTECDWRRKWFADLPKFDAPLGKYYFRGFGRPLTGFPPGPSTTYNFSAANLYRKYGNEWRPQFADLAHQRLKSWGINTIGNWSDVNICAMRKTPYTATVYVGAEQIGGNGQYRSWFPDVFDPDFPQAVQRAVAKFRKTTTGDPWCIGYFVDNELPWGDENSLGLAVLTASADLPAKITFVCNLKTKYETIARLNNAWETKYASWDALLKSTQPPKPEKARDDLLAFYERVAKRYFVTCRDAVKEMDFNGLYLGCRFAAYNDLAIKTAASYCDAISFNIYDRSVADFNLPDELDKPVIVSEFQFGALDRGLPHPSLVPAADQQDRADSYKRYVTSALKNRLIVGAHWFQFSDQPFTGRFDGENFQIGFIDICDTPNPELIDAAREIGGKIYSVRMGK